MFLGHSECPKLKEKNISVLKDEYKKTNSTFTHLYQNLLDHNYFPQMYTKDEYYSVESGFKACDAAISNYFSDADSD